MRAPLSWLVRVSAIAAVVGAVGCGGSYITIEVVSALEIPTQVDALHVITVDPAQADRSLVNVLVPLRSDDRFPVTVLLDPAENTPEKQLVFRIRGLLANLEVAAGETRTGWRKSENTQISVELVPEL